MGRTNSELDTPTRMAVESTTDSVFLLSPDWRFTFLNQRAIAQIGDGRELVGQYIRQAFPEGLSGALYEAWQHCMAHRVPAETDQFYPLLGRHLKTRAFPNPDGGITVFLRDITDARRSELALAESEAELQDIVATLDLASVLIRDFYGTVRFWSAGCERVYGWTAKEAVGRNLHELLATEFPTSFADIEAALLRDGYWRGDLRQHRRDGKQIVVNVHKVLRRDASGRPIAVTENVSDVTRLRQAEDELRRLNENLSLRVQEEVSARERAMAQLAQSQRLEALGQLAGGIAHDFNNVLQAVAGGASLIQRRAEDPGKVRQLARMVADAISRGAAITGRLLAFARRTELHISTFSPVELLENLREMLTPTLGGNVSVHVRTSPDLPELLGDQAQLETVLVNLAINARDAMPKGGDLVLSAAAEHVGETQSHPAGLAPGDYIRLQVTDSGTGMDEGTLARACEPFFTTKPAGRGTGLGLSMARGFAQQSGGALAIRSAAGQGTTVTLWFPQAQGKRAAGQADCPEAEPRPVRQQLLVVDDDPMVREVLVHELESIGYEVAEASDGLAALARIDAGEKPNLLVTDYAMPGMNGWTLIEEARRRLPDLPAVVLTGYAEQAVAHTVVLPDQTTRLLRKPITTGRLAASVAALLPRAVA
jgi:PAS domain S-box-containing protein